MCLDRSHLMEHSQVGNGRMCEDSHIIIASINIVFDIDNIGISHRVTDNLNKR